MITYRKMNLIVITKQASLATKGFWKKKKHWCAWCVEDGVSICIEK
jgi:hypothetical protein